VRQSHQKAAFAAFFICGDNPVSAYDASKIQSSPKCKAWEEFASIRYADCLLTPLRSASYVLICKQENQVSV
jgi:hypothetical protein